MPMTKLRNVGSDRRSGATYMRSYAPSRARRMISACTAGEKLELIYDPRTPASTSPRT